MNILKLHHANHYTPKLPRLSETTLHPRTLNICPTRFLSPSRDSKTDNSCSFTNFRFSYPRAWTAQSPNWSSKEELNCSGDAEEYDYLAKDGAVFQKTLRLVETAMFAAVSGLAYLLSNSLAIENYFGCFFALPIVISSMRWGVAAGRKTMVATFVLLFVLSGPVKAVNYVLMHGLLGFTMGSLWRFRTSWMQSIFFCAIARAIGALGYVLLTSFLIRENILQLITLNIHASLSYILTSIGSNSIPTMDVIYTIFGTVLIINSTFFVLLLHILYAIFFTKFGMKASLRLPKWVDVAI
ncbi:unnamed protein product [Cuscuta epithymum]|uniref:DUF2232 domain-containing protein n=1 Tax=Cuscuta epithymum TaxID=186058 RepID=A0AAV0ENI6_9ASTE|nr:unnamed protein product [Cuscuta epithymum]